MDNLLVSVVIPIYNEEETLPELYRRLSGALVGSEIGYEIIFVSDGSTDRSAEIIKGIGDSDPGVKMVELSRNFGHQTAITAGMDHASGDAVVLMDGDLQDPPEMLPEFLKKWEDGYDVVYAVRTKRKENLLKRLAFDAFYRALNRLSSIRMPLDAGIFSLMDRKVVDVLRAMPERNRYISGLRTWAGFRQTGVPCERGSRHSGPPKQTLMRLLGLAADGIFSFSYLPLRMSTFAGAFIALISFVGGLAAIYLRLSGSLIVPMGWASTMVVLTFLSGLILLMLGMVGEYIARIYNEIKARPQYVVRRKVGFKADE